MSKQVEIKNTKYIIITDNGLTEVESSRYEVEEYCKSFKQYIVIRKYNIELWNILLTFSDIKVWRYRQACS